MTEPPQALRESLRRELVPQQAFTYRRDAWLRWLGHLPGVEQAINALPDTVDRGVVARTVEDLVARDHIVPAFVAAMIWGHGRSNYGPYRTARLLTGWDKSRGAELPDAVVGRLTESILCARRDGPVEGFRYLNNEGHIKGLGPAFFTKWLYFVTARGRERSALAAPVLDALVITWLRMEADIRLRRVKTSDYQRYLEVLRAWGEPRQLTPVEVEEHIFRLIRADGATTDVHDSLNGSQGTRPGPCALA